MKRKDLDNIAKSFFDRNKNLKAMYATESGHFFYDKGDRNAFMKKSEKAQKAVDYTPASFEPKKKQTKDQEPPKKVFSFDECPAGEILKKRGFKSVAELKAVPDLSSVSGIGQTKADEIKEYLKNFD